MEALLAAFLFIILNFGISWWNAYAVGRTWVEAREQGGFARGLAWSGAIMSACGFTWVYTLVLSLAAGAFGYLAPPLVMATMKLGYVVIILPILGSGFAIWVESLNRAWRERTFGNIATAGWNSYAQIHNTYGAVKELPGILSSLGDDLDADDEKGVMLVLLLVAFALAGGVLTTYYILTASAKAMAREVVGRRVTS